MAIEMPFVAMKATNILASFGAAFGPAFGPIF